MKPDAVEFTALARAELEEAIEYIAARNPDAAMRLRTAIGATLATLAGPHPRVDGPTARLNRGAPCRRCFVHPVTLYYDRAPGLVLMLHVWHHAREPIAR
jgi:plasmid stabilization system protein ParE